MTLGKVYYEVEEEKEKKVFIPHRSDGFPKSKVPHNYVVKWTDGTTSTLHYVTGNDIRILSNGRKPESYIRTK